MKVQEECEELKEEEVERESTNIPKNEIPDNSKAGDCNVTPISKAGE